MAAISSAKDELVDVREYEIKAFGDYVMTVTARVYREYQETLKKNNALDYYKTEETFSEEVMKDMADWINGL